MALSSFLDRIRVCINQNPVPGSVLPRENIF
jgi:hypothetical protein